MMKTGKISWHTVFYLLMLLVAILLPFLITSRYILQILITSFIFIIVTCGLNLIIGYTGQVSLAQAGFFAIGAYTVAILTTRAGESFWLALIAGAVLSALVGAIIGMPMLRTRGSYFAIATLCFGVIISIIAGSWSSLTGGYLGIVGIPLPSPVHIPLLGEISFNNKRAQYYLVLSFLLVTLYVFYRLVKSPLGLSFMAVRNNESLAAATGINVFATKLISFTIASFFAGLAGGLYATVMRTVSPEVASVHLMFNWIVYLLLGGAGTLAGPVVGTLAITTLSEITQSFKDYSLLIFGALLVVAMIYCPRGLVGIWDSLASKLRNLLKQKSPVKQSERAGVKNVNG